LYYRAISLQIQVCREGNVSRGLLGDYNLDQGIALISLKFLTLGAHPVNLYHQLRFLPCTKVVSVARAVTGEVMARSGILVDDSGGSENFDYSSRSENGKGLMFSTCKISEVHLPFGLSILICIYQHSAVNCSSDAYTFFLM
jgi:hypothetical protein